MANGATHASRRRHGEGSPEHASGPARVAGHASSEYFAPQSHHRFRELSLPRFAAWGAVGGLLLTLFPFALVAVGLASHEGSSVGTGQILAVITPLFVLLSAASASLTLILARNAERREARAARDVAAGAGALEGQAYGDPAARSAPRADGR